MTGVSRLAHRWLLVLADIKGTAGANVVIMGVSLAASLLAARLLGPEHRGILAAAVVYSALASAVGDAGLNQAVPYFAARHRVQAPAVLGTSCVLAMTFGSATALGAYLILRLEGGGSMVAAIYLASVPFGILTTHLAGYMYGGSMLTQFNMLRTLQAALLLAALVVAAALRRPDVKTVLIVAVISTICLALASVATIALRVPLRLWTYDRAVARGLLGYAARSYVGNLCWLLNSRLDQLMMSFLMSAASLGVYATSVSYAGVVFSFFSVFAMLAFAKASEVESQDEAGVRQIVRRYTKIALGLGLPTTGALILAAPWLYPVLFGEAFRIGVRPAMVLCVAGLVLGVNYILSNGLRIRNRPLLPSAAEGIGVVVSVGGLWWALPLFGIMGAACVSLASYAAVLLSLLYFNLVTSTRPRRVADPVH